MGDYFQVDFGGMVKLSAFQLNNTQTSSGDVPGTLGVFTSQDGVNFSNVPADTSPGSATTVFQMTQETLRAVRIKILGTTNSSWWSVGELQITQDANNQVGCQL